MGFEGELRGFARKMPRFRMEMHRGFAWKCTGFRVLRAGKREENGGSRAAVGQGTAKVCMPCLFAWFFFVIRGGYAQRNTFFGRSGRWQRASCD